jgi:hypothetical protein
MKLEDMKVRITRIKQLLDDPHPGLFTWQRALAESMDDLCVQWEDSGKVATAAKG